MCLFNTAYRTEFDEKQVLHIILYVPYRVVVSYVASTLFIVVIGINLLNKLRIIEPRGK